MSASNAPKRAAQSSSSTVVETVESLMLQERTKWAMRIHDGLTQSVTSAVLELQTLQHRIAADPNDAIAAIAEVEAAIREDLSEIREVLFELHEGRPSTGAHKARPEPPLASFVEELVERWKLPARVSVEGSLDQAPAAVLETAHAVIAEAIANAAKHSGSPDVTVRVRAENAGFRIEIEDRGHGFGVAGDGDPHFGLRLMRARAEDIGGTIEIGSTPGSGTRVVALLPVGGRGEKR